MDIPAVPPALDCWFLTGPTASGKTSAALELAQRINAEIISLDSMTIYRGLDIGTAKPTPEQQRQVFHHLLDVIAPTEEYSLANYLQAAHQKIDEIRSRSRQVLFAGGTPLYLKALLRGLWQGPPPDWEFRRQVAAEVERVGVEALHRRLQQVDPLSAAKLHPNDQRRIIRALEVYKMTGERISHLQTQFEEAAPVNRNMAFVLQWPRAQLHRRIELRVDQMFADGLVEEVRQLLAHHGPFSRTAAQAVGYREVLAHLEGRRDLEATIEQVKIRTRQFARRQDTWFRSLSELQPISLTEPFDPSATADQIVEGTS